MLYYRKKYILALFELFGKELSAKRIQKLLFLSTRGNDCTKIYDFVPFKYGSFSFMVEQDLMSLVNAGYLANITLTGHTAYKKVTDDSIMDDIEMFDQSKLLDIKETWQKKSDDELIRYVYQKYPFYAINSSIAKDLLTSEEYRRVQDQKERLEKKETELFTIGYEGLSLEKYLVKLILKNVRVLCDVRKNAFSMKYGFSKATLQKACEGVGIQYVHIPQLGIVSDKRQNLNTQNDYNRLFAEYERTTLVENHDYLNIILEHIRDSKRVALTCFEKDPLTCHRSRVAKEVMKILNNKILYEHII
jgi:uncharacterized protein (DUF488 family)